MNLASGARVHFMGICGTAMASLAGLFKQQGFEVSGSDKNIYPPMSTQLESLNIPIMLDYKPENLNHKPDLVIVGNVISKNFLEAQELLKSKINYTSLPKALSDYVIQDKHSIVVSGTHGKTTTASIIAWLAKISELEPGFLIGGIPKNFDQSFAFPKGDYFIVEGDEYDTAFFDKRPKFIHYKPQSVILTSVEFDHADIYNSLDEIKKSFMSLIKLIPQTGLLIYNSDDKNVCDVVAQASCRKISYGLKTGDYRATNQKIFDGKTQFNICRYQQNLALVEDQINISKNEQPNNNDEKLGLVENLADISIQHFGDHSILNALASFVLSTELGWSKSKAIEGLASFEGVKRRQEIIGQPRNITVIEDFAHHPTSVGLTVKAIKERYLGQKVFAVFEPRSATSRKNIFQNEYIKALSGADEILITKVFDSSKIDKEQRFSSKSLVNDLKKLNKEAHLFTDVNQIVEYLSGKAQPKDIILIMSNGSFDGIYLKLLSALENVSG